METNDLENQDSIQPDSEQTLENQGEETTSDEKRTLLEQKKHWRDKAEAAEKELAELRKKPEAKSKELDYGQKAYLRADGIRPEEFDFVQEQIDKHNVSLEDLLASPYFKQTLQDRRDAEDVTKATSVTSKRSTAGFDLIDNYIAKGTPLDQIDDFEIRRKIVNKRLEKEKVGKKFADISVVK